MPKLSEASLQALYCMFKGEWGTRKSTAALSFPSPQYWFSWDQKMEAMKMPAKKWGIDLSEIDYDDYNDFNKAETKLKRFQTECKYKTIVLDSISSCGDYINAQTLKIKEGTTKQSGEEAGRRIAGISINTMEDYKAETAALQTILRLTKDIHKYHKVNVILIAHVIQEDVKNKEGQVTHVARSIVSGAKKMAFKMPAYCHEVYHFNMKGDFSNMHYSFLTEHSRDDFARTALPLNKEIVFNEEPIYEKYILPAIKKLETMEGPKKF